MAETMIPMPGMEVEISVQGMQASRFEAIEAAEAARSTAETERENAERARASAEQARVNAESARNAAESGRKAAEEAREQNEAARAEAEGGRVTAESARVEAENLRALAETGRAASEAARAAAESARASAEQVRAEAESERAAAEAARQETFETNEVSRQETFEAAENDRATAEAARESAEAARQAAFETNEVNRQAAFAAAEAARASAETARAEAESGRVAAEELREETFAGYESRLGAKLDNTPDTWPEWTADAQAAARARMGIPGDYELIEEITLEEDISAIERKTEPDGTPYNFKHVMLIAEISPCEIKLAGGVSNGYHTLGQFGVNAGSKGYFRFNADLMNADVKMVTAQITAVVASDLANAAINTTPRVSISKYGLSRLRVDAASGVIPSGSVIKIYGVRA